MMTEFCSIQVASEASRIYIYGHLEELEELAAHLATISSSFGALIGPNTNVSNTLARASLSCDAAPPFAERAEGPSEGPSEERRLY